MNWLESSHQIITILVIGVWLVGFSFQLLGKKAKGLDWLCLSTLSLFAIGIAIDLFFVNRDMPGLQKIWGRGWIGPRDQNGAITIGILEDSLGLTVAIAGTILGALLSLNRRLIQKENHPERIYAGVLMSVAGVAVSWLALTPWLAILGLTLTTLGGAAALGAQRDPEVTSRFGQERMWGFVFTFLGAAVLGGGRHALSLDRGFSLGAGGLPPVFDSIGSSFLVLGVYLYLQPFPFFGWLAREPKISSAASLVMTQLFAAMGCFGLVIRFETELRSLGVFSYFEWIALVSALLAAICGIAQENWKTALPLWVSAAMSFAFADLCFSGGLSAFTILMGIVISAAALSFIACSQEWGTLGKDAPWLRALLFAAMAPGMGMIGFVSCGGYVRMMTLAGQDPVHAASFLFVLIIINFLLWKCAFSILSKRMERKKIAPDIEHEEHRDSMIPVASAGLLLILSLGLLWSGTITGGALPHDPDRVFSSWFGVLFGSSATEWGDDSTVAVGEGLFWAGVILPGLFSFWLFGRGDRVIKSLRGSPGLYRFLQTGYGIDHAGEWMDIAFRRTGKFLEYWISEKISITWLPAKLQRALNATAHRIARVDQRVYLRGGMLFRQWFEAPAKTFQLILNGDLQWYLFFAIGSIVAILIHFLR